MLEFEQFKTIIDHFQELGFIIPILLTFLESVFPFLPLVVIVSFNIMVFGFSFGFIYSYIGAFLGSALVFTFYRLIVKRFFIKYLSNEKIKKVFAWIEKQNKFLLFILICMPFAPSSLINFGYGLSDYKFKDFILILLIAKMIMIFLVSISFHYSYLSLDDPRYFLIVLAVIILFYLVKKWLKEKHDL